MKYRARCNKRVCQARKTIKGVYDPNDRVNCHMPGCDGLMRIDVTRERDPIGDRGYEGLCRCDGIAWADMRNSPHRKGIRGCVHYEDHVTDRSLKPIPKHSPRQKPYEPEGEPPF